MKPIAFSVKNFPDNIKQFDKNDMPEESYITFLLTEIYHDDNINNKKIMPIMQS